MPVDFDVPRTEETNCHVRDRPDVIPMSLKTLVRNLFAILEFKVVTYLDSLGSVPVEALESSGINKTHFVGGNSHNIPVSLMQFKCIIMPSAPDVSVISPCLADLRQLWARNMA